MLNKENLDHPLIYEQTLKNLIALEKEITTLN